MSELAASIKTPKIIGSDKKCGSECEAKQGIQSPTGCAMNIQEST